MELVKAAASKFGQVHARPSLPAAGGAPSEEEEGARGEPQGGCSRSFPRLSSLRAPQMGLGARKPFGGGGVRTRPRRVWLQQSPESARAWIGGRLELKSGIPGWVQAADPGGGDPEGSQAPKQKRAPRGQRPPESPNAPAPAAGCARARGGAGGILSPPRPRSRAVRARPGVLRGSSPWGAPSGRGSAAASGPGARPARSASGGRAARGSAGAGRDPRAAPRRRSGAGRGADGPWRGNGRRAGPDQRGRGAPSGSPAEPLRGGPARTESAAGGRGRDAARGVEGRGRRASLVVGVARPRDVRAGAWSRRRSERGLVVARAASPVGVAAA